jgi:phosphoglycolate phosphatase-like HAD superfamily hydrolase
MNLVMFDIDGTLTDTNEVDYACTVHALSEVFGVDASGTDWTEYENSTDRGCIEEFARRHLGRPATEEEAERAKELYLEILVQRSRTRPEQFEPIPGAIGMLEHLQRLPEAAVSLATGAIQESSKIKLGSAGFSCDTLPMASGSDALAREEIMLLSEKKAAALAGTDRFRTRAYVGDALWDLQAAKNVGFHFIGIARGARAEDLQRRGAPWVVPDYGDRDRFMEILRSVWNGP